MNHKQTDINSIVDDQEFWDYLDMLFVNEHPLFNIGGKSGIRGKRYLSQLIRGYLTSTATKEVYEAMGISRTRLSQIVIRLVSITKRSAKSSLAPVRFDATDGTVPDSRKFIAVQQWITKVAFDLYNNYLDYLATTQNSSTHLK